MESKGYVARRDAPGIGEGRTATRFASSVKARYPLPKVHRNPDRPSPTTSFADRLLAQTTRYRSATGKSFLPQHHGQTDFRGLERMQHVVGRITGLMHFVTARALRRYLRQAESEPILRRKALRTMSTGTSLFAMQTRQAPVARSIGIADGSIHRLSLSETSESLKTGTLRAAAAGLGFALLLLQRVQEMQAGGPSYRISSFLGAIPPKRGQTAVSIPGIESAATEPKRARPWTREAAVSGHRANRARREFRAQRLLVPPSAVALTAFRARAAVVSATALQQANVFGSWQIRSGSAHMPIAESRSLPAAWRFDGQRATDTGPFRAATEGFTSPWADTEHATSQRTERVLWRTNRPQGTPHTNAERFSQNVSMRGIPQQVSLFAAILQRQERAAQRTRTAFRPRITSALFAGADGAIMASVAPLQRPTRRSQHGATPGGRTSRFRALAVEATAAGRQAWWLSLRTAGLPRPIQRSHVYLRQNAGVFRVEQAVAGRTEGTIPVRQSAKGVSGNLLYSVPVVGDQRDLLSGRSSLLRPQTALRGGATQQMVHPEENGVGKSLRADGVPGLMRALGERVQRGPIFGIQNRDMVAFRANRLPPVLFDAYRAERAIGESLPGIQLRRRIPGAGGNDRHTAFLSNGFARRQLSQETQNRVARIAQRLPSNDVDPGFLAMPSETRTVRRTTTAETRVSQRQRAHAFPTLVGQHGASHGNDTPFATETHHQPAQEESDAYAMLSPAALRARLVQRSGPGRLLESTLRARLGPTLGFDPTLARVHQGPVAAEAARQLRAEAFTIGTDVFFGADQFRPMTLKGLGLLAHELTHVGQQRKLGPAMRFFTPQGGDAMEQEAQQKALQAMSGANEQEGMMHPDVQPPRPSMAYAPAYGLPKSGGAPEPAQTATEERGPNTTKPTPSPRRADPRAVADRVYELMQQELAHIERFDVAGRR